MFQRLLQGAAKGGVTIFPLMKQLVALAIVLILYSGFQAEAEAADIKDVKKTHTAYSTVSQYVDQGYVTLQNGYLYPNRPITRGEIAQLIFNALKLTNDAKIELKATDLPKDHPNYAALHKLIELGIMDNSEQIRPDALLTRAQMAKVIAISFNIEVDAKNNASFIDYSRKHWAKNYIESLADVQIVQGKTTKTFAPNEAVTRLQTILLVSRGRSFVSKVNNLDCVYDYLSKNYVDTKQTNKQFVSDVIALVNKERAARGLTSVKEDPKLSQLAVVKLNDIIQRKYFEHKSSYYGYPWDMANYFDYEFRSLGENLAKNLYTPTSVMKGWMASVKHKENILKPIYTHIGIAVKQDQQGNYYWVQLFSSK